MPNEYTGYGADKSPPFALVGIVPHAKTMAIIMADLDIPFIQEYAHWLIWNLPAKNEILGDIPQGKLLSEFGNAQQGLAYGKHEYKGPKPPKFIRSRHRYVFTVYILDTVLNIESDAKKRDLLNAMQGHVLQKRFQYRAL